MYKAIQNSSRIAIFTHIHPDGDALGSSLGLLGYLDGAGKESTVYLPSDYGESLAFIVPEKYRGRVRVWNDEHAAEIESEIMAADLLIGLDFNVLDRIGGFRDAFVSSRAVKILVDHHVGPEREAFDKVYSDTEVSSTCELLYRILLSFPDIGGDCSALSPLTRRSLMAGMTTDSNNFANSVFPGTLAMASELIAAGTDRDEIIRELYFNYPLRRIQAQGYALSNLLHVLPEGGAYIFIGHDTQELFALSEGDTEGFVNIPLSIAGVTLSVLLKEEPGSGKVRVSIRSKAGTSARDFAIAYCHGGGHELASGGKLVIGEDIASAADAPEYIERCLGVFLKNQYICRI